MCVGACVRGCGARAVSRRRAGFAPARGDVRVLLRLHWCSSGTLNNPGLPPPSRHPFIILGGGRLVLHPGLAEPQPPARLRGAGSWCPPEPPFVFPAPDPHCCSPLHSTVRCSALRSQRCELRSKHSQAGKDLSPHGKSLIFVNI